MSDVFWRAALMAPTDKPISHPEDHRRREQKERSVHHRDRHLAKQRKPLFHAPHHDQDAQDRSHQNLALEFPDFLLSGSFDGVFLNVFPNAQVFVAGVLDDGSQSFETDEAGIVNDRSPR